MLSKSYVLTAVALLEQGDMLGYLEQYVAEDVIWTITGTNVLSGTYRSRQEFIDQAIARLNQSLDGGIQMDIHNVYVDGDTAILEMTSIAQAKKGHPYHNEYIWIQRFYEGKVIEARVYYDDVLVNNTMLDK